MKKFLFFLFALSFGYINAENNDTLSCLELSAKLVNRYDYPFFTYKIELRSGEELIKTIHCVSDESFTFLLKKDKQYSISVFFDGKEIKKVFVSTSFSWESTNIKRSMSINIEFKGNEYNAGGKELDKPVGYVNFNLETSSFFKDKRLLKREKQKSEQDFDITKPKY